MNFRTTLILLVVVLIGLAIWMFTPEGKRSGAPTVEEATSPTPETRYLLDPRPDRDKIVLVRFERADKPTLVFERTVKDDRPEKWRMVEPLESPTESYIVDGLVTLLTGLQYQRSFTPGEAGAVSPAEAGLEPPAAVLTVKDEDGTEYSLEIGGKAPLSKDMYVRLKGRPTIYVVARDLRREIDRKVNDYRAKTLIRLSAANARRLAVEHEDRRFELVRNDSGDWVFEQPVKCYAREPKVRGLINALGSLRVKEYIDDAPASLAAYGLEKPYLSIDVTTEKKEKIEDESARQDDQAASTQPAEPQYRTVTEHHRLLVGAWADLEHATRYAKLPEKPWVFSVTKQQIERLVPKLSELRDPKVLRVRAADITGLELRVAGQSASLEKQEDRWVGTGDLAELDQDAVQSLIDTLVDLHASDYVDEPDEPAKYGLDQPRASLTVHVAGDVAPVTLNVGRDTPSGRNTWIQVVGQPSVLVISAARARDIARPPLTLRSRVITDFEPAAITNIELERKSRRYVLARDGKRWRLLEPDAPADEAATRELANDLARLRARQVVAREAFEQYGLSEPQVRISFTTVEAPAAAQTRPAQTQPATAPATQPTEHRLLVATHGGKVYARFDDLPYVFELDKTVHDVFTQELIRRGVFDVTADQIVYLKISAPGGTVEFERRDGKWVYVPDPTVKLSQKKVGDFVKELAATRASAYVAYRAGDLAKYGLETAPVEVSIRTSDHQTITLRVAPVRPGELPRRAAWVEQQRIFLLTPGEAQKLMRGLDYYALPDTSGDSMD